MSKVIKAKDLVERFSPPDIGRIKKVYYEQLKEVSSILPKPLPKTQWHLVKDFVPIFKQVADLMTQASLTGHHYEGEWEEETIEHQAECQDRHNYDAIHGEYLDTEFGYTCPHSIKELTRLFMRIYKEQEGK